MGSNGREPKDSSSRRTHATIAQPVNQFLDRASQLACRVRQDAPCKTRQSCNRIEFADGGILAWQLRGARWKVDTALGPHRTNGWLS